MNLLIIGAKGFIGKHLECYFSNINSYNVYSADILPDEKDYYFQINPSEPDFDSIFEKLQLNVCINASGAANVKNSFIYTKIDFDSNAGNIFRLLDSIKKHQPSCKFLNLSSAAVYGNVSKNILAKSLQPKPVSPYGYHKYIAEIILQEFAELFGIQTCSARLFSVYGEGQDKLLFWDLWQKYKRNNSAIELFGTGEEARDFIYIKDVVIAIHKIIESNFFDGNIINVGNGQAMTIKDAATEFYNIISPEILFAFSKNQKQGDPDTLKADISDLLNLGYTQSYSLKSGLKNYIEWLQEKK